MCRMPGHSAIELSSRETSACQHRTLAISQGESEHVFGPLVGDLAHPRLRSESGGQPGMLLRGLGMHSRPHSDAGGPQSGS